MQIDAHIKMRPQRQSCMQENGAVLLVVVFVTLGLLFLCALAIGLGFVQTSRGKFQNNVNLAALGALAAYVESPVSAKIDQAKLRAEAVLAGNPIPGTAQAIGLLGSISDPGPSGYLEYGQWLLREPAGSDPCPGRYPCFLPVNPLNEPVNAIRIVANTQEDNGIEVFFGNLLSTSSLNAAANATATLVERCTAYLLDVSPSVHYQTHIISRFDPGSDPIRRCLDPNCSVPFFQAASIGPAHANPALCNDVNFLNSGDTAQRKEKYHWCTMEEQRYGQSSPSKHYRSDYRLVTSKAGNYYVDAYFDGYDSYPGPQPFSDLFLAFNAALTAVREQASANDKAMVAAFSGLIRSQEPATGLTSELDRLIQLTNLNYRGLVDLAGNETQPTFPNFLDKDWFPVISLGDKAQTNLVTPLEAAIQILADGDNCSPTAQKSIILATDGLGTCRRTGTQFSGESECKFDWEHYYDAEQQLIGASESVLTLLQQNQIRLTVLHTGDVVGPNFVNRVRNGEYIDPTKAQAYGLTGFADQSYSSNPSQFFDVSNYDGQGHAWNPVNDDEFKQNIENGAIFRRPVGVLGKLAIESGGIYAPLLERRPSSMCGGNPCYICPNHEPTCVESEKILDPIYREADRPQEYSTQNLSKGEQAAKAATQTVGGNPYILVEQAD